MRARLDALPNHRWSLERETEKGKGRPAILAGNPVPIQSKCRIPVLETRILCIIPVFALSESFDAAKLVRCPVDPASAP